MFDEAHVVYRYKYLPFDEGALAILRDGTIKFSDPLTFNDPFDCLPYYDASNLEKVPKVRPDLYRQAGNRRGLSPAKRVQERPKFIARLRARIKDGTFAREQLSKVGVVSLSRTGNNIVMWSHYARYHEGFALEFRIPLKGRHIDQIHSTDRLLPFPVVYSDERPRVTVAHFQEENLVEKILLTKSTLWSYEEEERVITESRRAGIYPFRRDEVLWSVIAGMKMSESNYFTLNAEVERLRRTTMPHLVLYRAKPQDDKYAIFVAGHPRVNTGLRSTPIEVLRAT